MTDEDFTDDDDLKPEEIKSISDISKVTKKINNALHNKKVDVVMGSLTSAVVQALCMIHDSKNDAHDTAIKFGAFLILAIDKADEEGICNWNATIQ